MPNLPYSLWLFSGILLPVIAYSIPQTRYFFGPIADLFLLPVFINLGMIGIILEAPFRRISLWWLVVPLIFYSTYASLVVTDRAAFREVISNFTAANSAVSLPFDPDSHALVLDDEIRVNWLVRGYDLPVAYVRASRFIEGYRSVRVIPGDICSAVAKEQKLSAAGINTVGPFAGPRSGKSPVHDLRSCNLFMPERPALPIVTVTSVEQNGHHKSLPVNRVTTFVTMPDGNSIQLLSGSAQTLGWIPMPYLGCDRSTPSRRDTGCKPGFSRSNPVQLLGRDVVADALGLKPVKPSERRSGDDTFIRARLSELVEEGLAREIASIERIIADPRTRVAYFRPDILVQRIDELSARPRPSLPAWSGPVRSMSTTAQATPYRKTARFSPIWSRASHPSNLCPTATAFSRFTAQTPRRYAANVAAAASPTGCGSADR